MEPRARPFGILLGPPVVAIGLAVALAYSLRAESAPKPTPSPDPPRAATELIPPKPASPRAAEPTRVPPPVRPPAPSTAPAVVAAPPPQDSGAPWPAQFANPEVRAHASLMITEAARKALKERNLEYLRSMRASIRDAGVEPVLPASDLLAIDLGIDCLARAEGARQRTLDFIEDNPSSVLLENLREACL